MQSVRCEVLWSNSFENNFLLWSTNLQLYQVQNLTPGELIVPSTTRIRLSEQTVADVAATNSDHQYVKCVALQYGPKEDPLQQVIAVGQADGKIVLTNFAHSSNIHGLTGKEFVPRNCRSVNTLAWNPQFHHLLAAGFNKAGKDHSIYVIDVNKGNRRSNLSFEHRNSVSSEHLQTTFECSTGDTVHSVDFSRDEPQALIAGINNRQLKLYDFRDSKSGNSTTTKAVYGISVDPFNSRRFASYVDNIVHVWDMRNFERPVSTLSDSNNKFIFKLSWCPTRYGFLSSLSRDSSSIRLYDIQQHVTEREDQEPTVILRSISPKPNSVMSSFDWHPLHENRILATYCSGEMVDHYVRERITLNWSTNNTLMWSNGKKSLQFIDDDCSIMKEFDDISLIKDKAKKGYGLQKEDLSLNGTLTDDLALKRLWTWLEEARALAEDHSFKIPGGGQYNYQGISTLLNSGTLKSDIHNKPWAGVEGARMNHAKVFTSEERTLSLALCSWGFEKEGALHLFLDHLEMQKLYTRAAAVAVFNLHIPQAIKILQKGAVTLDMPVYNTTAMALAGFTCERKLWRETCSSLLKHISDPYLRTTFSFLTGDAETFDPILNEENITIHDRVAFACKYLSDVRLLEYIQNLKLKLIEEGNLDGILLTGLNSEGYDLLQRYIDITGDIQTPALLVIHTIQQINVDPRLQIWVDSYRNLLDSLQMWKERVQIDVLKNQGKDASELPHQIHISCNLCLKSISVQTQPQGRPRNAYDRAGTSDSNKLRMTACPNPSCRRPLPRCSLCLHYMGTPSKRVTASGRNPPKEDSSIPSGEENIETNMRRSNAMKKFNNWFTWCNSCHHGGHAQHMMQWFKDHLECPVMTCACKCMSIDPVNKLGPQPCMVKQ